MPPKRAANRACAADASDAAPTISTRMRRKTKAVPEPDPPVPEQGQDKGGDGDGLDAAILGDNIVCAVCKQGPQQEDRHGTGQTVPWQKKNKSVKTGSYVYSGSECYWCFCVRRKWEKSVGKTITQTALIKAWSDGTPVHLVDGAEYMTEEQFLKDREAYGKGLLKYKAIDVSSRTTHQVQERRGDFGRQFRKGHFYRIQKYVQNLNPTENTAKWSEKECIKYVRRFHPDVVIIRDDRGFVGVREENLPTGADYAYEEGAFSEKAFVVLNDFDDEEQAEKAAMEVCKEGREAEGEDLDLDEESDDVDAGEKHSAHGSGKMDVCEGEDAAEEELFDGMGSSHGRTDAQRAGSAAQSSAPWAPRTRLLVSPSTGPSTGASPRPSASAASVASTTCSGATTMVLEPSPPEKGGEAEAAEAKETLKKILASLRSTKKHVVFRAAEQLLVRTDAEFNAEALWQEPKRMRDSENRAAALQTASNRVTLVVPHDDEDEPKHTVLAEKIIMCKTRVLLVAEFLLNVKSNAEKLLRDAVPQEVSAELESMESKSLVRILIDTFAGAVKRINLRQPASGIETMHAVLSALDLKNTAEMKIKINLAMIPEASQKKLQQHVVVDLIDKMMRCVRKEEFFAVMDGFVTQYPGLLPTVQGSWFLSGGDHEKWCQKAFIDLSFLVIAAEVLLAQGKKEQVAPTLASAAKNLVAKQTHVTVRLRTFARQKKSDTDLIRLAWDALEQLDKAGRDVSQVQLEAMAL